MENRRELVLWLLHILALQSRSVCLSRSRRSRPDGNDPQYGKRDSEHCGVLGEYKVCTVWNFCGPQRIWNFGPDILSGTPSDFCGLSGWGYSPMGRVYLSEFGAPAVC